MKGLKLYVCVLALCTLVCPLGNAEAPQPLSPEEVQALLGNEANALASTEWGAAFQEIAERRAVLIDAEALNTNECIPLALITDKDLDKVIAFGETSAIRRIGLFFPDRILDALDMFSGGATLFPLAVGIGTEIHITRYASIGLGAQAGVGLIMWYYNRNLMTPTPCYGALAMFGPWQAYAMGFVGAGTGWTKGRPDAGSKLWTKAGRFSKKDKIAQDGWSDPWAIGAGWAAEIHPVEIADFLTGFLTLGFVDISKDDYAYPSFKNYYKIGTPVEREAKEKKKDKEKEDSSKQEPAK